MNLSGHSSKPHNEAVKRVFDQAVRDLRAIDGNTVSGNGYSNDDSGRVDLSDSTVK
jgi:hypothetical protein